MPDKNTFKVKPIGNFVKKYLKDSKISIDPFARDNNWATYTNDLNLNTAAQYHLDAIEFLDVLIKDRVKSDLIIFDPPYSPRQISECYNNIGRKVSMKDTQSAVLYKNCRDKMVDLLDNNGIILSFGWNSVGMGKGRGFEIIEIMLCCHGGAHNDTICLAEIKIN